jgi:hypothetical protein
MCGMNPFSSAVFAARARSGFSIPYRDKSMSLLALFLENSEPLRRCRMAQTQANVLCRNFHFPHRGNMTRRGDAVFPGERGLSVAEEI